MQASGFPVDLVLFAMIAGFLVLRLRSILGKRTGFEGVPVAPAAARAKPAGVAPEAPAGPSRALPDPAGPVGRVLVQMRDIDRKFDPAKFLAGAEGAFRLIVAAFAAGNRDQLRPLLAAETFAAFESVIAAREAAGETQRTDINAIEEATIIDANLAGSHARINVRFVSLQVNLTTSKAGEPVAGTDAVTEMHDVWSFERDLAAAAHDPTWKLTAARSA